MPWLSVPTQRVFSRSKNSVLPSSLLLSSSGVTNGFHGPPVICCNPSPGPELVMATHRDPSGLAASPDTPVKFATDFNPEGVYVSDEPSRQRVSPAALPIQRFPSVSSASAAAVGSG